MWPGGAGTSLPAQPPPIEVEDYPPPSDSTAVEGVKEDETSVVGSGIIHTDAGVQLHTQEEEEVIMKGSLYAECMFMWMY